MSAIPTWTRRFLNGAQGRFRRARPGSVLIMVVSLLVLLALIGTAAVSSARIDRQSSRYNIANTQIDMLTESVKQMVIGAMMNDLFTKPDWNITDSPVPDANLPALAEDAYLGTRLPDGIAGNMPAWVGGVSYPPFRNNPADEQHPYRYNDPLFAETATPTYLPWPIKGIYQPTVHPRNSQMPALQQVDEMGAPVPGAPAFMAGDADGDGIADSILFRLPMSPLAGVTYYAAVRVVDNGAAVNVNTAGDPTLENTSGGKDSGTPLAGFPTISVAGTYPASINLAGLIKPDDMIRVWNQRVYADPFKNPSLSPTSFLKPCNDGATVNGNGVERDDFRYLTPGDMWHNVLGRRLNNPGYYAGGQFGKGSRPFGLADSMSLAFRFCLGNPAAYDSAPVELALQQSARQSVTRPYTAGQAKQWYLDNFNYSGGNWTSRPLVTAYNPGRNTVNLHLPPIGTTNDQLFGRWIGTKGAMGAPVVPPSLTAEAPPVCRANLNHADFEELWRAYFNVMCDSYNASPFDAGCDADVFANQGFAAAPSFKQIDVENRARMFRSPIRQASGSRLHPFQVMVLRAAITAANNIELRTITGKIDVPAKDAGKTVSVEAVNAYDITLPNPLPQGGTASLKGTAFYKGGDSGGIKATVYGFDRHPFITEVYLNNNVEKQHNPPAGQDAAQNKRGLAVVKIYNPYNNKPADLNGWKLAVIDRAADGQRTMEEIFTFHNEDVTTAIPNNGYMILSNRPTAKTALVATDLDSARYSIPDLENSTAPRVHVKLLHAMIGKELVLLRPARPGYADMGNTTLPRYCPCDSFDATGLPHQEFKDGAPQTAAYGWHYLRASDNSDAGNHNWHCVYPGRYDGTQGGGPTTGRQQGTEVEGPWDPSNQDEPWAAGPPLSKFWFGPTGLGADKSSREYGGATNAFPIQIGHSNFSDQFKGADGKVRFPNHGFLRTGDMLQITYIGSYTLWDTAQAPLNWTSKKATFDPTLDVPTLGTFVEINSPPIDSAFADDGDKDTDDFEYKGKGTAREDIGRFAPLFNTDLRAREIDVNAHKFVGVLPDDASKTSFTDPDLKGAPKDYWANYEVTVYNNEPKPTWASTTATVTTSGSDGKVNLAAAGFDRPVAKGMRYTIRSIRYGWADDFFEYLTTINAPADDYLPNMPTTSGLDLRPVKNDSSRTATNRVGTGTEDDVPVEGLINVNTANWKVLATVPMVMQDPTTLDVTKNNQLAQNIVYYRDVDDQRPPANWPADVKHPHGPFKSFHELLLVPGFATDPTGVPATSYQDFSPMIAQVNADKIKGDWEEKYNVLTRICNVITLHSDCYTAYVQVQGWRAAGTPNAQLVVQRRLAFILDRSGATKARRIAKIFNIPTAF